MPRPGAAGSTAWQSTIAMRLGNLQGHDATLADRPGPVAAQCPPFQRCAGRWFSRKAVDLRLPRGSPIRERRIALPTRGLRLHPALQFAGAMFGLLRMTLLVLAAAGARAAPLSYEPVALGWSAEEVEVCRRRPRRDHRAPRRV
jgi:hypothetical protein